MTRTAGVDEESEPPVIPGAPRLGTFRLMGYALSVWRRSGSATSVVDFLDHASLLFRQRVCVREGWESG